MASNELLIDMAARVAKWQDDSGAWHDVVFAASAAEIRALLEHIEAQEETLQEYRETLASQYAAIVEDNDLRQQLETAQAEAAAMRQELDRLDTRFFVCPECGREAPEVHVDDCALARSLSGTAGQALLDELAALELVSSEWKVLTEIDYLRADVQHLQDVAEAAKTILVTAMQACKGGYRGQPCPHGNLPTFPTHAWWCDPCFFALKERLEAAGYLREKDDAE